MVTTLLFMLLYKLQTCQGCVSSLWVLEVSKIPGVPEGDARVTEGIPENLEAIHTDHENANE